MASKDYFSVTLGGKEIAVFVEEQYANDFIDYQQTISDLKFELDSVQIDIDGLDSDFEVSVTKLR